MLDSSAIKTRAVRQTYEYWLGKSAAGRVPRRTDIKPEELRTALPYIFLVDVSLDPLGFRFRLVGTAINEWAGKEYTRVAVTAAEYGPEWLRVFESYRAVVDTCAPQLDEYFAPWRDRQFRYYERMIAPLSQDGDRIDMLFGALHVLPAPGPR